MSSTRYTSCDMFAYANDFSREFISYRIRAKRVYIAIAFMQLYRVCFGKHIVIIQFEQLCLICLTRLFLYVNIVKIWGMAMDALKFYLKDKKWQLVILSLSVIALIWLIVSLVFSDGGSTYIFRKTLITCAITTPVIIFTFIFFAKKYLLVFFDFKKQVLLTETIKVDKRYRDECTDKFSGWYLVVKGVNGNGKKFKFWYYQRNLDYPNIYKNQHLEITYYKYSKCIFEMKKPRK